jgi:hypothetical protein
MNFVSHHTKGIAAMRFELSTGIDAQASPRWARETRTEDRRTEAEEIRMNWSYREPTLDELLSDSLVKLVMKADGVDTGELEAMLRRVAASRPKERAIPYFSGHRWFRDEFTKAAC